MASSAILRSAARALRLRQPLEQQRPLLARRLLSSSVPTERCRNLPSSTGPSNSTGQKRYLNEEQDILRKMDHILDAVDRQERLLRELEAEIKADQKNSRVIDLTPWVGSIPVAFLLVAVYNYM